MGDFDEVAKALPSGENLKKAYDEADTAKTAVDLKADAKANVADQAAKEAWAQQYAQAGPAGGLYNGGYAGIAYNTQAVRAETVRMLFEGYQRAGVVIMDVTGLLYNADAIVQYITNNVLPNELASSGAHPSTPVPDPTPEASALDVRRVLKGHQVNPANDLLDVLVLDEPGDGGASHNYLVRGPSFEVFLHFQNGPIAEKGVNGITQEALLEILIDRLTGFQSGRFANTYNQAALEHLQRAQGELLARTKERVQRGVEGTHQA